MSSMASTRTLQCMEIVGGNSAVAQSVRTPGLDMYVQSWPHHGDVGGDIHYFSVCGSGRVTRLAIADVSGHGAEASEAAVWLRGLMRKHINVLDQREFARQINRELLAGGARFGPGRFVTAALMTYFAPTGHLIVCNGGHPPPLWYSAPAARWSLLTPDTPDRGPGLEAETARYLGRRVSNLPLGVIDGTDYVQFAVKLSPGDLVVVYTDGLAEARNPAGQMLGLRGLLDVAAAAGADTDILRLSQRLMEAVMEYRGGQVADDDLTMVVMRHSADRPAMPTLRGLMRALPRLLGFRRR